MRLLPRVYPILDTTLLERLGLPLIDAATVLADSGARLLQLRHKGNWTRAMFDEAAALAALCGRYRCQLIINDRADIARLLDAGLHVGQEDLPPSLARRILGTDAPLGFSTHNRQQLEAATASREPASYLALGPIFATSSKANPDPVVGVDGLRELRPLSPHPLVAIGGIKLENAVEVWSAGADSIALISDLFPSSDAASISERFKAWRRLGEG